MFLRIASRRTSPGSGSRRTRSGWRPTGRGPSRPARSGTGRPCWPGWSGAGGAGGGCTCGTGGPTAAVLHLQHRCDPTTALPLCQSVTAAEVEAWMAEQVLGRLQPAALEASLAAAAEVERERREVTAALGAAARAGAVRGGPGRPAVPGVRAGESPGGPDPGAALGGVAEAPAAGGARVRALAAIGTRPAVGRRRAGDPVAGVRPAGGLARGDDHAGGAEEDRQALDRACFRCCRQGERARRRGDPLGGRPGAGAQPESAGGPIRAEERLSAPGLAASDPVRANASAPRRSPND